VNRAEELVREFQGCFWFRHPDARVRTRGEILAFIRNRRKRGEPCKTSGNAATPTNDRRGDFFGITLY
jgi:hypothetical protein